MSTPEDTIAIDAEPCEDCGGYLVWTHTRLGFATFRVLRCYTPDCDSPDVDDLGVVERMSA